MSRTISINGRGEVRANPDTIILRIVINIENTKYDKCLEEADSANNQLVAAIQELGIDKQELRTTELSIDTNYKNYNDEHGNWHEKFVGYKYYQKLELAITVDFILLGKIINAISSLEINPELNINFILRGQEELKAKALQRAVESAKNAAELLCKANGKTLGELVNIEYNEINNSFNSPTNYMLNKSTVTSSRAMDISPEDVEIFANVNIKWEILD